MLGDRAVTFEVGESEVRKSLQARIDAEDKRISGLRESIVE